MLWTPPALPGVVLEVPAVPYSKAEEFNFAEFKRLFRKLVHYFRHGEPHFPKDEETVWLSVERIAALLHVPKRMVKELLDGEPDELVFKTVAKRVSRQLG